MVPEGMLVGSIDLSHRKDWELNIILFKHFLDFGRIVVLLVKCVGGECHNGQAIIVVFLVQLLELREVLRSLSSLARSTDRKHCFAPEQV